MYKRSDASHECCQVQITGCVISSCLSNILSIGTCLKMKLVKGIPTVLTLKNVVYKSGMYPWKPGWLGIKHLFYFPWEHSRKSHETSTLANIHGKQPLLIANIHGKAMTAWDMYTFNIHGKATRVIPLQTSMDGKVMRHVQTEYRTFVVCLCGHRHMPIDCTKLQHSN